MQVFNVQSEFQGNYRRRRQRTNFIVVHHAAAVYSESRGIDDVRAVAAFHTAPAPLGRGWPGIGYTIALAEQFSGGPIARYNLSDYDLERAHVFGRNDVAIGVSCLTNFTGIPEQKWVLALAEVIAELCRRYPDARIVGHREIALAGHETACPGPRWIDWKPRLLGLVETMALPQPNIRLAAKDGAWVRISRSINAPRAMIDGNPIVLPGGYALESDDAGPVDGWWHIARPAPFGFIHDTQVQRVA